MHAGELDGSEMHQKSLALLSAFIDGAIIYSKGSCKLEGFVLHVYYAFPIIW